MSGVPKWARRKSYAKRVGFWLFAFHPWFVRLLPSVTRHESTIDEPTISGLSVVWLGVEVSYVRH